MKKIILIVLVLLLIVGCEDIDDDNHTIKQSEQVQDLIEDRLKVYGYNPSRDSTRQEWSLEDIIQIIEWKTENRFNQLECDHAEFEFTIFRFGFIEKSCKQCGKSFGDISYEEYCKIKQREIEKSIETMRLKLKDYDNCDE